MIEVLAAGALAAAFGSPLGTVPRVYDDRGAEIPYVLVPLERTFTHGAGTRAIFDRGAGAPRCEALALRVERAAYFTRVAIDEAGDARHWRTIRDDALAYRVARDETDLPVTFTPTCARYVRVRVLDGRALFPLAGVVPLPSDAGGPSVLQAAPVPPRVVTALFTGAVSVLAGLALRLLRQGNPDGDGGEGGP